MKANEFQRILQACQSTPHSKKSTKKQLLVSREVLNQMKTQIIHLNILNIVF